MFRYKNIKDRLDPYLHAITLKYDFFFTGQLTAQYQFSSDISFINTLPDGRVVFTGCNMTHYLLNNTLNIWHNDTVRTMNEDTQISALLILKDGRIAVGTLNGVKVYTTNFTLLYQFMTQTPIHLIHELSNGHLLINEEFNPYNPQGTLSKIDLVSQDSILVDTNILSINKYDKIVTNLPNGNFAVLFIKAG